MVIATCLSPILYLSPEEREITNLLISVICSYGGNGVPLEYIDEEFEIYTGYSIPYKKMGYPSLSSFLMSLPEIYIIRDRFNQEVVIQHSRKSAHIKELVDKQKPSRKNSKRKMNFEEIDNEHRDQNKKQKRLSQIPEFSFVHTSIKNPNRSQDSNLSNEREDKFNQLESMLPLFYKHQALGDEFFLDIADSKMGYYVPENGPKQCGLCIAGQTICELLERVHKAENLAPRVVVMIGLQDIILGHLVSDMAFYLKELVQELLNKETRVTLVTLIPNPKLAGRPDLQHKVKLFNKVILEFASDPDLKCNIIDMHTIFEREAETFKKDFDRFTKLTRKDPYKVFSDYGRKIFLSGIKSCLKEQIEAGH